MSGVPESVPHLPPILGSVAVGVTPALLLGKIRDVLRPVTGRLLQQNKLKTEGVRGSPGGGPGRSRGSSGLPLL